MVRTPSPGWICVLTALLCAASTAHAQVVVPDDYPTIEAAFASGAEEVSLRPGVYPETPVIDRPFVLRALLPAGSTDLPEIAGLVIDDANQWGSHSANVTFADLRVRGPVRATIHLGMNSGPLGIRFERCVLDSGLTDDDTVVNSQHGWAFSGTRVDGPLRLRWPEGVSLWGCLFTGPVTLGLRESAHVIGNRFEGPGALGLQVEQGDYLRVESNTVLGRDVGIDILGVNTVFVTGNLVEGSAVVGVRVRGADGAILTANRVRDSGGAISVDRADRLDLDGNQAEDCAGGIGASGALWADVWNQRILDCGSGLYVDGEEIRTRDNYLQSCGGGITLVLETGTGSATRDTILDCGAGLSMEIRGGGDGAVTACRVIGAGGPGISLSGRIVTAAENVVGRASGHGIVLAAEDQATLRRNTSYLNEGSGLALLAAPSGASVSRNIGHGNARYGLEAEAGVGVTLDTNDWHANVLGAVHGASPSPTDVDVDPLFCDLVADDVYLGQDSPLAGSLPDEPIGALGIGCEDGVTPTLVSLFAAEWLAGAVVVRWRVLAAEGSNLIAEVAADPSGPWHEVAGATTREGDLFTVRDPEADTRGPRWYRLAERSGGSHVVLAGPIRIDGPAATFRLIGISPNPAAGLQRVEFSLERPASIAVEVFDLQGRLLATLARGHWAAGRHAVDWRSGQSAPSGLYVVRFSHPGGAETRRLMRAR